MSRKVSIESVIRNAIESRLISVHTCIPGMITSVGIKFVDVAISILRIDNDGNNIKAPVLMDVPVMFSSGGGSSISHSLSIGDEGLILFQERDFSVFEETGKVSPPIVFRKHDYSDAVFIPCGVSKAKRIDIPASGISVVGDLNVTGEISATGDIIAGTISLKNHVHVDSQGGNTQAPTP